MALSKASCTGRGVTPAIGGHVHHMFDGDEDDLFALSLDDVMDDRPWTADELMGGGTRPSSPNPPLAPKPAQAPAPVPVSAPAPAPIPAPAPATMPAPRPASDPSETAAFLAAAAQGKSTDSTVMYSAQQLPVPAARKSPITRLNEPTAHQVAYDSWAAADLDETSTGMPALDVPVNPLFAANTSAADYEGGAAYSDYSDGYAGTDRIETEDYGNASSDYLNDPYAATPAPEYDPEAASAPAYTKSTGEERFADYYAEEKALRFSEFPQAVKVAFIAIVIALLGVIAFEGFRLFSGPTQAESETQQKEDDNEYLDINTLKGDPNDGDDE
ncbi:hypothetical protein PMX63_01625 [Collinsella aerofaciens]|uniref:hypothetical protein n=1 Tax=Collinsella aerofaciens TaxID=74426 RepID=UPI00189FF1C2|nr:hypothetical protein [Collinsella aerofaciens]MDB1884874.1 hypothetical protein [Collinsella aerofaciens]MDB1890054.1 hypothetical protein [Collinsella aerofaciens]MDB1890458.1 hypothetical protein [Collinsella aerofaciens]MDB1892503.1 hypothetical protein [Collinsella aerofaciens]